MGDFMAEHAREFGLVSDQSEQPARDMHDPAGRGKCIHPVGVENDELPIQIRARTTLR